MKRANCLLYTIIFLAASTTALAEPIIVVGNHPFLPNEIKTIAIPVTGDVAVQGLNFCIQIEDGGAVNNGTATKPIITAVDISGPERSGIGSATIFHGNNTGQSDDFTSDLLWAVSTTTENDTVNTSGTLAYVTIDTTGTLPGETYSLSLKDVAEGTFGPPISTDFSGLPASITNGTITIVPEPGTLVLLLGLTAVFPLLILRRRHK